MSNLTIPEELLYTTEHEWILKISTTKIRVGITDFAQNQLGDIVFVQLPDIGSHITLGDPFGEIESTKSVSDIYSPASGKIVAINELLKSAPQTINTDPYGEGWIVDVELTADELEEVLEQVLNPEAYKAITVGDGTP